MKPGRSVLPSRSMNWVFGPAIARISFSSPIATIYSPWMASASTCVGDCSIVKISPLCMIMSGEESVATFQNPCEARYKREASKSPIATDAVTSSPRRFIKKAPIP